MKHDMDAYYREYGKKVYLYLMTLCRNPDEAEELTQETFFQAIKSIHTFQESSSVYTWLCGIAKKTWLYEMRKHKNLQADALPEEFSDTSFSPDRQTELKEEQMHVLKQIHLLPEHEKEIILLRASAGLSFREIGEIFSKSENWARVTYYRARNKIKKE